MQDFTMTAGDFSSLIALYNKMDAGYDTVAAQYGFQCNGCKDNCCQSLFFHYTFVEKAFLRHGFFQMDAKMQKNIRQKAANYITRTFTRSPVQTESAPKALQPASLKMICPLNQDSRCTLYFFRPMICRLHGLPHELTRPGDSGVVRGPGCDAGKFEHKPYIPFDRTPFYIQMAGIEQSFRKKFGRTGKIRETIAHILVDAKVTHHV
jgi:hypothetical protein